MTQTKYRSTKTPINSNMTVVQNERYQWGVINPEGEIIVPFGKYAWIDGYQNGLAKVIGRNDTTAPFIKAVFNENMNVIEERIAEQGIINEAGEEVLPLEYRVWKFYEKDFPTIKYFKGNFAYTVSYCSLKGEVMENNSKSKSYDFCYDDYNSNDFMRDAWDAMTDGVYGDMPEGFKGDFEFLGY